MKIYISSDTNGKRLKDILKNEIEKMGYEYEDLSKDGFDFVDSSSVVCEKLLEENSQLKEKTDDSSVGVVIDNYGAGSYMACSKFKGIVAAEVSDERSALMTKRHNGARILVLGQEVVGEALAKSCLKSFLSHGYDGGRHQIRIDMLNKML
ncbi:galactose-6-phosphate isomerase subunit LacA [Anaerococcus sp. AGMB00486]|uniref:Galactose-6-phosphate isomerase subunit LacA n=2 Tax=Anaerococcus TaxID=165779 RepID=A0ABX2N8Y9_9FIRM|nr:MULTISPECIES: galactose-6-phosphate isomerase subunit LacA [Anaerococcus]MDY3005581.1 galactose-6-phosphate isomerase subunit LacA [Anaerococcus porci]MSS77504.1 galactose-6-phosphate isomerase subunit LacA [Anaerococcus porci]NVF11171.1 galactose-6-phosphate isomerase subunit LacA [Anaerococcus faecalis]